jgi:hypothetical protein
MSTGRNVRRAWTSEQDGIRSIDSGLAAYTHGAGVDKGKNVVDDISQDDRYRYKAAPEPAGLLREK